MNAASPFFIVNPNSANGATRERFLAMLPVLRGAFPDMGHEFTNGPLHAATLAREAAEAGAGMVVSCGGDGTLNETVNGLYQSGCQPLLAVVPSGTGGDFKRVFGFQSEPDQVVSYLKNGMERRIDHGLLEYEDQKGLPTRRAFVNIASFGISGVVDHYVNTTSKALGGKVSFFVGTLRGMLSYENVQMTVTVDGRVFWDGLTNLVAVANGRFFGGGMMVAPQAQPDDGLFDVVVFEDMTRLEFVGLSRTIYSGGHLGHPKIRTTRGRVVEARSVLDALIDLDGEQPGKLPCRAEVVAEGMRLLVP